MRRRRPLRRQGGRLQSRDPRGRHQAARCRPPGTRADRTRSTANAASTSGHIRWAIRLMQQWLGCPPARHRDGARSQAGPRSPQERACGAMPAPDHTVSNRSHRGGSRGRSRRRLSGSRKTPEIGSADHHGLRAERNRLHDVATSADPPVEDHAVLERTFLCVLATVAGRTEEV